MKMMTISNLPGDLVDEILSRVPLKYMRAVRLTCKSWNDLSKSQSFTKGESQMIVLIRNNIYLTSIVLNGDPSTEHEAKLTCLGEQVKVLKSFQCEGLLLCILKDDSRFVVWNPYLGQPTWIEPRYSHGPYEWDMCSYALRYVNKESCRSYKLLRFIDDYCFSQLFWYEIYDLDSDLWTTLHVTRHWRIPFPDRGVSLKGNTYWCAKERNSDFKEVLFADRLICFDFTSERFGPLMPMPMPFNAAYDDYVSLSCVREEKLAVLLQHNTVNPYEFDLWITTKIETGQMLWCKFLRLKMDSNIPCINGNFYLDKEKRVAISFNDENCHKVNIIGEDGYFRALDLVGETKDRYSQSDMWSYVPSLVQIKQTSKEGKRNKIAIWKTDDTMETCQDLSHFKRINEQYACRRGREAKD